MNGVDGHPNKDHRLLKYQSRLDELSETRKYKHEWRLLIADKMAAGLLLAAATLCGNMLVEHFRDDRTSRHEQLQASRLASHEVWLKLKETEREMDRLDNAIRSIETDRVLRTLATPENQASHQKALALTRSTADQALNEAWSTLDIRAPDLTSDIYAEFSRIIADERQIYLLDQGKANQPETSATEATINADFEKYVRDDLARRESALTLRIAQLY